jgi:hypothetical protein
MSQAIRELNKLVLKQKQAQNPIVWEQLVPILQLATQIISNHHYSAW